MLALKVLRLARAKIESGWTQETDARDEWGYDVTPEEDCAVCWCTVGALQAAMSEVGMRPHLADPVELFFEALIKAHHVPLDVRKSTCALIEGWNDHPARTQQEVLQVFDGAIASLEAEGGRDV